MFKNLLGCRLFTLGIVLWFISFRKSLSLLIVLFFCIIFFLINQHLTILLVQLEVLGLGGLVLLALGPLSAEKDLIVLFTVMVVTVIEASVGLRLTVKQARYNRNELLKFNF